MKQKERTVLVIIGVIGMAILFFKGYYAIAWVFLMAAAFVGECTEVIASRMERILVVLENQQGRKRGEPT